MAYIHSQMHESILSCSIWCILESEKNVILKYDILFTPSEEEISLIPKHEEGNAVFIITDQNACCLVVNGENICAISTKLMFSSKGRPTPWRIIIPHRADVLTNEIFRQTMFPLKFPVSIHVHHKFYRFEKGQKNRSNNLN